VTDGGAIELVRRVCVVVLFFDTAVALDAHRA
jgi:hypothetical protein